MKNINNLSISNVDKTNETTLDEDFFSKVDELKKLSLEGGDLTLIIDDIDRLSKYLKIGDNIYNLNDLWNFFGGCLHKKYDLYFNKNVFEIEDLDDDKMVNFQNNGDYDFITFDDFSAYIMSNSLIIFKDLISEYELDNE